MRVLSNNDATIYLAGGMAVDSSDDILIRNNCDVAPWRDKAIALFSDACIMCACKVEILDPRRRNHDGFITDPRVRYRLGSGDMSDVRRSDVVLVNISSAGAGTWAEVGMAAALDKRVVGFVPHAEPWPHIDTHPLLDCLVHAWYVTLSDAVEYIVEEYIGRTLNG